MLEKFDLKIVPQIRSLKMFALNFSQKISSKWKVESEMETGK